MDEVSFKLKDANFSSVFNATKGLLHLPLNERSKPLTAMFTPLGVYVCYVFAMGLSNSKWFIWIWFKGTVYKAWRVWSTSLMIFWSLDSPNSSMTIIWCLCRRDVWRSIWKLTVSKIRWNCSEVPICGQHISAEGIMPDPNKVKAIKDWPVSSNVKELQSFLGSVNYLSHFVPELSSLRNFITTISEN